MPACVHVALPNASLMLCLDVPWVDQDSEAVLELLVQRGEVSRALAVLRQPSLSRELIYKFAPPLMAAAPADTVRLAPSPTE